MPRIRQYAQRDARSDFKKAIGRAQVDAELTQKKCLAEAIGIPYSTLWNRLENPDGMSLEDFRRLLTVLPIPPEALLSFVGYSAKDIRKLKETA